MEDEQQDEESQSQKYVHNAHDETQAVPAGYQELFSIVCWEGGQTP